MPQFPWDVKFETLLLSLVVSKGAHLWSGKGILEKWTEFTKVFFEQDELIPYKGEHAREDEKPARKIRDKYNNLRDKIKKEMETGNQSGKSGDRSDLYKLVEQIENDIEEAREEKEKEKEGKRALEETADKIVEGSDKGKRLKPAQGWGTRVDLNGEIMGNDLGLASGGTSSSGGASLNWESAALQFLMPKENEKKTAVETEEEKIERKITAYIDDNHFDELAMIAHAKLPSNLIDVISDITVAVIVNIYCSPHNQFSAKVFKESLAELGLPVLACHKLHVLMQTWKRNALEAPQKVFTTPQQVAVEEVVV